MSRLRELLAIIRCVPDYVSMRLDLYAVDIRLTRHREFGAPIGWLSETGRFDGCDLDPDREMPWCADCDVLWPCPDVEDLLRERLKIQGVTA